MNADEVVEDQDEEVADENENENENGNDNEIDNDDENEAEEGEGSPQNADVTQVKAPQGEYFHSLFEKKLIFLEKLTQLPLARIKKMIKNGDPEWKGGSQDAQLMIVYAAERFCSQLADRVWEQKVRQTGMITQKVEKLFLGRKTVQLRDLTSYLESDSKYDYLEGALTGKTGCLHGLTK